MRGFLFFLLLISTTFLQAQQPTIPVGKTTDKPEILDATGKAPFTYEPVDPEFWEDIVSAMNDSNYTKMIVLAAELISEESNTSSDEAEEAKLALAMGLAKLKVSYGASVLLSELAKSRNGTKIGEAALYELHQLATQYYYERVDIGENLLTSNEFGPVHPDIQGFIGYHAGLFNLTSGYKEWADLEFAKIQPNSHWDYQMRYLKALGEVARDRFDSALNLLEEIKNSETVPSQIKTKATLQLARLKFEQGDYNTAYNYYYNLDLPLREKGRVYLERAWTKFYLKDYSKALGLIAVLDAPMFDVSPNPESYILKMLIYRELCHYEAVVESAGEFRDKYAQSMQVIKSRGILENDPIIAAHAFQHESVQYWANFINQLRQERMELRDYDWGKYEFYPRLLALYQEKDKQIQERVFRDIEKYARDAAREILDAEEQITFLDYTAKLDSLRIIRKGENRTYKSEKIPYLTFNKMYWPVQNEHWLDELEDYQVLIRSRCGESQLSTDEFAGEGFE